MITMLLPDYEKDAQFSTSKRKSHQRTRNSLSLKASAEVKAKWAWVDLE